MNLFRLFAAACLALAAGFIAPAQAQPRQGVLIGTGVAGGVYYPLGGAVCRLFNFTSDRHGLRCAATVSAGSVDNIERLRAGHIDVAIVQSDVLADAIQGAGPFAGTGAWPALRTLFAAHDEPFTIVARDAGISTSADLAGKRINIGDAGSGHRLKMERLMAASGIAPKDFAEVLELNATEQVAALCAGRLDAMVYSVGHPNGLIQEATAKCGGRIVPIQSERIQAMLERHREYRAMSVPGRFYAGQPAVIPSFGISSIIVVSEQLSDTAAYELVKSVFDDFGEFVRLHPAFAPLEQRKSAQAGSFAPLHLGAEKYFRERGLIP